jgi:hypothetical protein
MEGLRKTTENVSQDSQSRDQNFTLGVLTTRPRCSVNVDVTMYNLHLRFDVEPSYTSRNSLTAINVFRQIRQTYWCLLNRHLALITVIDGR